MKADIGGNPGKTAVYIALSLLIHAAVFFGTGIGNEEAVGNARLGPLRVRSLSLPGDETRETPAPEAEPTRTAPSDGPPLPAPSQSPANAVPPSDAPPSPDPEPGSASSEASSSEAANRIEQALGGWNPAAGSGLGENRRSVEESAGIGPVREVPFAELDGNGLELPVYPELARKWGWEGIAAVRIRIGPAGNVREAEIIRSSGYDVLDRAALKTVTESWTFSPPGRAVETVKEFEFLLKSKR